MRHAHDQPSPFMMSNKYSKEFIKQVKEAIKLEIVVDPSGSFKKSGKSLTGDCPFCGAKNKFSMTPSNQLFNCYKCDEAKGIGAFDFIMKLKKIGFVEAIEICAKAVGIPLEKTEVSSKRSLDEVSFRDQQLRDSGIPDNYQISELADGVPINRYESGGFNRNWDKIEGDDMCIHYIGLDRMIETYINPETGEELTFFRIRYKKPEERLDRYGDSMKYCQRKDSGLKFWIPENLIRRFEKKEKIKTLIITEGEKKADKLCVHGIMALGVSGINNWPKDSKSLDAIKRILIECQVEEVVFLYDADWQEISDKRDKSITLRPRTFFSSAKIFKNYFSHFKKDGIELSLFLAYVKNNAVAAKGIDDLFVDLLKCNEDRFVDDLENAKLDINGQGEFVGCYNITTMSEYKLRDIWHLKTDIELAKYHKEKLRKWDFFYLGYRKYKVNDNDEIEAIETLRNEEKFWTKSVNTKSGNKISTYSFYHSGLRVFLKNQGFGILNYPVRGERFIQIENKIVTEVKPNEIFRFVLSFAEKYCDKPIVELLLKGGKHYIGKDKLSSMYELNPEFIKPNKYIQFMFFKNEFWEISKTKIQSKPYSELKGYIWKEQILDKHPESIKNKPKLIKDLLTINRTNSGFKITYSPLFNNCNITQFLRNTSFHNWKNYYILEKGKDGKKIWARIKDKEISTKDLESIDAHMSCKMVALGYLLCNHLDLSETKAIICMDRVETQVGMSNGGTGKSIYGQIVDNVIPMVTIDGKKRRLTEDQFIYQNVDEKTQAICIDDCRANLDFEFFFGHITRGVPINKKNVHQFTIRAPKFLFTTNHAIVGEDNSYRRRQYLLAFSDYFNENRTPIDEFGVILFQEWKIEQWNLYYNLMASCIQAYLAFRLEYEIPLEDVNRRKLRQQMGEDLFEWAKGYFSKDGMLNKKINKKLAHDDFVHECPNGGGVNSMREFKKRIKLFCTYSGFEFNPIAPKPGGDIKSNSIEYLLIADSDFDKLNYVTIN